MSLYITSKTLRQSQDTSIPIDHLIPIENVISNDLPPTLSVNGVREEGKVYCSATDLIKSPDTVDHMQQPAAWTHCPAPLHALEN